MNPIAYLLSAVLGGTAVFTVIFLLGRLQQQRQQVVELRNTNVQLFAENNNVKAAYQNLREQVEKYKSGPVSATISFEQVQQIAEITAAKLDAKTINTKELSKRDVH